MLKIVGLGFWLMMGAAHANTGAQCDQLRQLEREYRGVVLTAYQKKVKVQLVAWYQAHCRGSHNLVREARKVSPWN